MSSEPRRLVAATRERQPDVQRADVAEKGAVLVPGAGLRPVAAARVSQHLGAHPAQEAFIDRDRRALTEILGRQALEPDALEHVEDVQHHLGGVRAQQARAANKFAQ